MCVSAENSVRRLRFVDLQSDTPMVVPSLLSSDFTNLQREVEMLEAAGAQALHLDIMDGRFVDNITIGMPVVKAIRRRTKLPLDVHLMIVEPQKYIAPFFDAGADNLTIHIEAVDDPRPHLEHIRELGAAAGITLRPATPLSSIENCLDLCDLVLVMSVEPGFGGQDLEPIALEKLKSLREMVDSNVMLEIDGGVNETTIRQCADAGAQLLVAGSAVFSKPDYGQTLQTLNGLARS